MGEAVHEALRRRLTEADVAWQDRKHAPAASARDYNKVLGCRLEQQAKCLLLRVKGGSHEGYRIMALPGSHRGDLAAIQVALGAKKVRMASREELRAQADCDYGELPPLGSALGPPPLAVLVHPDLLQEDPLYFNAGVLDRSMVLATAAFMALEQPVVLPASTAMREDASSP